VTRHADAVSVLREWSADGQAAPREAFLGFLVARPDAMARSCSADHLTASTVVLDATADHVLLPAPAGRPVAPAGGRSTRCRRTPRTSPS
jgi:hypothetical protein